MERHAVDNAKGKNSALNGKGTKGHHHHHHRGGKNGGSDGSGGVLKEAKRLWDMGFAIHWLRPESKMPLESGWTSGPRKSWEDLKNTYAHGMNVGVRLGNTSAIGDHYLAVVDVDVKSTDPKHKKEALEAARRFLGGKKTPVVLSGRGNGSRHYYILSKRPFKTFNFSQSNQIAKVKMPSKAPSRKELSVLTEKEIAEGYRLSRAWEVSLYSEGRQVVVPPSIHPDTKNRYEWARGIEGAADIPVVEVISPEASPREVMESPTVLPDTGGGVGRIEYEFWEEKVEVGDLAISDEMKNAIIFGDNVVDRSAFLLPAATALLSAGLTKNQILNILTNPEYFMGHCALERKNDNRALAAEWVEKYTLAKILKERTPDVLFPPGETAWAVPLGESESARQEARVKAELLKTAAENGYYVKGARGGLIPDYETLFEVFKAKHPYKSITDMGAVFTFNGKFYEATNAAEVKNFAEKLLNPRPSDRMRDEFWKKIQVNCIARREFFTRTTEGKINFQNGVLDLEAAEKGLMPHSPDFGFRGVLPFDFNPKADCPEFKKWLKGIMLGDQDLIDILQEYMGYIVRGGEYKYHKALWLEGTGRNGKSTFIDVLKTLIGEGNYSTLSIKSLMGDKFSGAFLDGKIANFSEETSPQELSDSGPFKNLTGDGDMAAQKKFGDHYTFRNRAKLIMSYNTIPDLKDLSPGMLSRPLIVPFEKIIKEEEQDRNIKDSLKSELSGIFNFAREGWFRLEIQNQFTVSEKSQWALKKIKEESCNVHQWVENYIEFNEDKEKTVLVRDLYTAYRMREKYPFTMVNFSRKLMQHPRMKKRYKRTKNKRLYRGLKVT